MSESPAVPPSWVGTDCSLANFKDERLKRNNQAQRERAVEVEVPTVPKRLHRFPN